MARSHFVKAARKDYPNAGIKKGESYYWWKFMSGGRGGPKHYSKSAPKPSQLTQSEFMSSILSFQESLNEIRSDDSHDVIRDAVETIAQDIRDLGQEQEDKISNMPESLQQGATADLLNSRHDSCEQWATDLESIDFDQEDKETLVDEIQMCEYTGE